MRMGRGHCQLQVCSWGVDLQPGRSHLQLMARLPRTRGTSWVCCYPGTPPSMSHWFPLLSLAPTLAPQVSPQFRPCHSAA